MENAEIAQSACRTRAILEVPRWAREAGPGELLRRDHARLDALFTELLDQLEEGNQCDVRAAWKDFDDGLNAHMDLEERVILPLFAQVDRAEAEALRAEHVRIRQLLAELGVGVDLHLVHLNLAREFIDALRAHARREDQLLYRWAERDFPLPFRAARDEQTLNATQLLQGPSTGGAVVSLPRRDD